MRRTLFLILMASAAQAMTVPVAAADELKAAFATPPVEARPMIRWWWPGGAVTADEIRRELEVLDKAGIGGAEIQAFNPGIPAVTASERERIDSFAEPSFFAAVSAATEEAARRGMVIDYTFGSAWPSGGGTAIPPERALSELTMAMTTVEGGQRSPVRIVIPTRTRRMGALSPLDPRVKDPAFADWSRRFDARGQVVAVMAFRGRAPALKPSAPAGGLILSAWSDVLASGAIDLASRVDLTARLGADGTLDWVPPPGSWQVFVFKQYASNMGVTGAAGRGPQLVLDHFDRSAFDAHARRVGDPLVQGARKAGIRATFVDSLELMQDLPWTDRFLEAFRRRRGYDLTPYLPLLVQPGWAQAWGEHYSPPYFETTDQDETGARVRADYRLTVSELLIDNFIEPWIDWNHARGFKAKFQAHGGAIDVLKGYGLADIPETEDLVHGGDPLFMRFARSAANIYGRPTVSAESMVWAGRPYSVTPDEMRRRTDLLISGGVNAQTLHGYTYRFREAGWPGWYAFQPNPFTPGFGSMLDERNPVWAGMPRLFRYMARLNAIMRQGESVVPVAMFYGEIGYYVGVEDHGLASQQREKALIAAGYDFDRINPDGLARSRMVGKQLQTPGGHRYAALILPAVEAMRPETARRIAELADAGLPVIFSQAPPRRSEGLKDRAANDALVRSAILKATGAGAQVVPEAGLAACLQKAGVPANVRFLEAVQDLTFVERRIGDRHLYFMHNRGQSDQKADFLTPLRGKAERWDAMDGVIRPIATTSHEGGMRIDLTLRPGESGLIVVDPAATPSPVAATSPSAQIVLPAAGWSLSVKGHVTGGAPYIETLKSVSLGDWSTFHGLARFSGIGTYSRSFKLPPGWKGKDRRISLELGAVHDMATVSVNGRALPPAISAPWSVDVTDAIRTGTNRVEIAVANVPQNAMIDPANPSLRKLAPVPAGLSGPVRLVISTPQAQAVAIKTDAAPKASKAGSQAIAHLAD
ncbi:hypothetical protein ACFB49_21200 [Sphingomonas sp. DBB INV C78]|uniref:glycosyl hydrolase n=1 Tax=Sphingomonas sp. DBB INV C78 TaxID=3349434 RepID=UPI0036D3419A